MNSPVRTILHLIILCVSAACSGTDAPPGNANTNVASVGGSQAAGGFTGTIGGTGRGTATGTGGKTSSAGAGSREGSGGGTGSGRAALSGGASGIGGSAGTASASGANTTGDATISGGKIGAGGLGSTSSVPAPGGNGGVGGTTMTTAKPVAVGVATKVTDGAASGGYVVGLTSTGQSAQVTGLPAASKLAIRYASVSVGTISVSLNGQTARKINVHSSGALLPYVERALVRSTEAQIEPQISAYPFQPETSIQDWHYRTGQGYTDARALVQQLMQNVSRNGTMLLNLTQRGRGDLDSALVSIAKDVGAWLKINGEAVYGSRPFEVMGDNTVAYTRNKGNVYATLFGWNGGAITLKALASEGATLGTVTKVELLGSTVALTFAQNAQGLTVTPGGSVQALPTIANQQLASGTRVLRITHDKNWVNDDDPGAMAPGWLRKCNLGTRDYNNDLTTSSSIGRTWTSTFDGTQVRVYAPREAGSGTLEIQVDGQSRATADLSTAGARLPQQLVAEVTELTAGQHTLNLVNRGPGPVAVDAIHVK